MPEFSLDDVDARRCPFCFWGSLSASLGPPRVRCPWNLGDYPQL